MKKIIVVVGLLFTSVCNADSVRSITETKIELDEDGGLIIPVSLFDGKRLKTFRFLLDTGSGITIVDSAISHKFYMQDKMPVYLSDAVGDEKTLQAIFIKGVEIAQIYRSDVLAVSLDVKNGHGALQDDPVDGILGMNFLAGTRFVLDVNNRRIEWWRVLNDSCHVMPIQYDSSRSPIGILTYNGKPVPCLLDSGAMGGFELPGELDEGVPGDPVVIQGDFGNTYKGESRQVRTLASGEAHWENPTVTFRKGWGSGTIGLDVISAAPICFDFIANRVSFDLSGEKSRGLPLLRPGHISLPIAWDRSGSVHFLKVRLVKSGSPMEKAGCKPGDELVRVGTLEGKALTRRSVMEWMAQGKPHAWVVRRAGVLKTLQFL